MTNSSPTGSRIRVILGDQLSLSIPTLDHMGPHDCILMAEVMAEATYVPHHPKKIAFVLAAMRHFARELEQKGLLVRYITLDDPDNTGSIRGEVVRAVTELQASGIIITEPAEYRLLHDVMEWEAICGIPVTCLPDTRFVASRIEFAQWAGQKTSLRMAYFYREMRKKTGLLMNPDGTPLGGKWDFDTDNRQPMPDHVMPPHRMVFTPDPITQSVLSLVRQRFSHHFGSLDPFELAVTREQAWAVLTDFITHCLPHFGPYQDAMRRGDPYLYHSLISTYLNAGLLTPLEVCQLAETAVLDGDVPLASGEGFIRQILGWREYVRGVYWLWMPTYGQLNVLEATEPLPSFYWTGDTHMACMKDVIQQTRDYAYSHHIQRLMVTGNFALLTGLDVGAVQDWYLASYSDAYEWVEMPNTLGMALFADGGKMASKPYAASGKYIQKMGNFCKGCRYRPSELLGADACPFNALYWAFISRHRDRFKANQRMVYMVATWDRFSVDKQQAILCRADEWMQAMRIGAL